MKKNKSSFHKNMETMTKKRIEAMQILDSENSIRFLFDWYSSGISEKRRNCDCFR